MATPPESELRIRIVAKQLPFHKTKLLCEWLNCFQYILPDERILIVRPRAWRITDEPKRASDYFKLYLWLDSIETILNAQEQICLLKLIQESEISRTLLS